MSAASASASGSVSASADSRTDVDVDADVGAEAGAASVDAEAGASAAEQDAFLCNLACSIAHAVEHLSASSVAAHEQIEAVRLNAAAHCDELDARVDAEEAFKRAALERERMVVDAALERLRTSNDSNAFKGFEADADAGATPLLPTLPLPTLPLPALLLPTAVVETLRIRVAWDTAAIFGRVIAPHAVTAADLTLDRLFFSRHAFPGAVFSIRLALNAPRASQCAEELEASLGAAASATRCDVVLSAAGAAPRLLGCVARACVPDRCIVVTSQIPLDAPCGSSILVRSCSVAGQPVAGALNACVVEVRVSFGIDIYKLKSICIFAHCVCSLALPTSPMSMRLGCSRCFLLAALPALARGRRCTAPQNTALQPKLFMRDAPIARAFLC